MLLGICAICINLNTCNFCLTIHLNLIIILKKLQCHKILNFLPYSYLVIQF